MDKQPDDQTLPPPTSSAPVFAPTVPPASSSPRPAVAATHQGAAPQQHQLGGHGSQQLTTARYVGDEYAPPKKQRSRSRTYTIAAIVFVLISAAGYVGFREYIYGDDAPPVIDFDR